MAINIGPFQQIVALNMGSPVRLDLELHWAADASDTTGTYNISCQGVPIGNGTINAPEASPGIHATLKAIIEEFHLTPSPGGTLTFNANFTASWGGGFPGSAAYIDAKTKKKNVEVDSRRVEQVSPSSGVSLSLNFTVDIGTGDII